MTVIRSPMDETDTLIHYGVLGMKWGVRKQRKTTSGKTSIFSKKKKSKSKTTAKKKTKRISEMTDAELIKKRERLRLEKEVKTLITENQPTAKRIAKKAITKAGERVVEEIVHDTVKYVVGEGIINKYSGVKIVNIQTGNDDKKKKDKAA